MALEDHAAKVLYFKDDDIWIEAKPVVLYLEYNSSNVTQTLNLVKDKNKKSLKELLDSRGSPKLGDLSDKSPHSYNELKALYVNEPGLYSLIFRSTKKQAQEFQDWVYEEVLTAIRRHGSYSLQGRGVNDKLQLVLTQRDEALQLALQKRDEENQLALQTMLQKRDDDLLASLAIRFSNQLPPNHSVLEISRSSVSAASQAELLRIGTKVDEATLSVIQLEGGPLHITVFLQERDVAADTIRRVTPTFSAEVVRRKLLRHAADEEGGPFWIAWSLGAWRPYHTEADRTLMEEVFEDPLTAQNLEQLEASTSLRKRDVVPMKARRRQGPYSVPVRGSSTSVTDVAIRAFFPPQNRQQQQVAVDAAATSSE